MPSHTYAHNYTALIVFEHTFMIDMSLMGGLGTKSYIGLFYSVYPNRFIVFLSGQTITFHSCTLCFIAAKSESLMCLNTFFFFLLYSHIHVLVLLQCVCLCCEAVWISVDALGVFPQCCRASPAQHPASGTGRLQHFLLQTCAIITARV